MKPLVKAYIDFFFFYSPLQLVKLKTLILYCFPVSGITRLNITEKDKIAHIFKLNEK